MQRTLTLTSNQASMMGQAVHIKDSNGHLRRFIVEDEPRVGILEISLEMDRTIVTHIGLSSVFGSKDFWVSSSLVSLKFIDCKFAISLLGKVILLD